MSFFSLETNVATLMNSYLIRIICARRVNVPTESQIRNMTLSHNYSTYTESVKAATFGNFIGKHCPK